MSIPESSQIIPSPFPPGGVDFRLTSSVAGREEMSDSDGLPCTFIRKFTKLIDVEKTTIAIVGLSVAKISEGVLPRKFLLFPNVKVVSLGAGALTLIMARRHFPRIGQLGGLVATSILAHELVLPILMVEHLVSSLLARSVGIWCDRGYVEYPFYVELTGIFSSIGIPFSLAYFLQKKLADYNITLRSGWEVPVISSGIFLLSISSSVSSYDMHENGYVPITILSLSAAQFVRSRFKTSSKNNQLVKTRFKFVIDSKTAIKFGRKAGSLISKGISNSYLNPRSIFVDWAAIVSAGWMAGMRTSPIALVGASVAFGAKVLGKGVVPASIVDKVVDKVIERAIPLLEKGMIEAYKKPFSAAADATLVAGTAFAFGATIVPACAVGATVSLGVKAHKGEISLPLLARGKSFLKFVASRLCGRRPVDYPAG